MVNEREPPVDPDCIFCKIVAGQVPCHKLYNDEHVLSFLDVGPLSRGHALVIPKGHWVKLDQVPDEISATIGQLLPRLSAAVMRASGAEDWNVLQNNGRSAHQFVDHVHFHIIPKVDGAGLGISWPADQLDNEDAAELRDEITGQLTR